MIPFFRRRKTCFIGDTHGCIVETQELIRKAQLKSNDRVIFLGDLINKGPASAEVIRYVCQNGFEAVLGNHDLHYQKKFSRESEYKKIRKKLPDAVHNWYMSLPPFIRGKNFIAVHGGLEPGKAPEESAPELLANIRTWDGTGKDLKDESNPTWHAFYTGRERVFYGHWAKAGLTTYKKTFGLDSGCVYGKKLSAWLLPADELVQVSAKKVYCPF